MDIHKPKPWHGVREFLKEYVIIVVGVLTALGAEQAVEALHTAHKAAEAEERVREELSVDLTFAQQNLLGAPCVHAEMVAAQRLLLAMKPDGQIGTLARLDLGILPFTWAHWEAAVASGDASHFAPERRRIYEALYVTGSGGHGEVSLNNWQAKLLDAGGQLGTLRLPPRRIDIGTRELLLRAARSANYDQYALDLQTGQFIAFARALHLKPAELGPNVQLATPASIEACTHEMAESTKDLPSLGVAPKGSSGALQPR